MKTFTLAVWQFPISDCKCDLTCIFIIPCADTDEGVLTTIDGITFYSTRPELDSWGSFYVRALNPLRLSSFCLTKSHLWNQQSQCCYTLLRCL